MNKLSYVTSQKLHFKEPKEPPVPKEFLQQEKKFEKSGAYKMTKSDLKKEEAMKEARKKLESVNFENRLFGKARERARLNRLKKFKYKY